MVSSNIKTLRKFLNLSQKEFGERLGVSRDVINNIENKRAEPKSLFIEHICTVFFVNKDWLLLSSDTHPIFDEHSFYEKETKQAIELFSKLNSSMKNFVLEQMESLLELDTKDS